MPAVPVRVGSTDEWAMVELQGELIAPEASEGVEIGPLQVTAEGGAVLVIGHHRLKGSLKRLERPLAVLERAGGDAFTVRGLVRSKLLFSQRPQPIVSAS